MQPGNFLRQPVGCSQCGPTPGRGLSRAGGWDSQAAAESGCVLAGAGFVPSLHAAVAQAETGCTLPSWGVGCRPGKRWSQVQTLPGTPSIWEAPDSHTSRCSGRGPWRPPPRPAFHPSSAPETSSPSSFQPMGYSSDFKALSLPMLHVQWVLKCSANK